MSTTTLIIAEAGVNHNGNLDLAKKLIDVAANAGADLVKFQTFNADRLVTVDAPKAEYQMRDGEQESTQYELLRNLELTCSMHEQLIEHCENSGIGFFSTGFDVASNEMLFNLGQRIFKIPSGEITNLPYLRYLGKLRLPIIMSTGMATMNEIAEALNVLDAAGTNKDMVTILHCSTQYPTPMKDVNLKAMLSIRDRFGVDVGYSDHTLGLEVSTAAVALGARIIEKHFTLDRSLPGPDHKASLEPDELNNFVRSIRNIETALGSTIKSPSPIEVLNSRVVRKSIVATKAIKVGETFTEDNLDVKRPGTGVSPMQWDAVLGSKAVHNFEPDDLIIL